MSNQKSKNVQPHDVSFNSIGFPDKVSSSPGSLSHEYTYLLTRPYFHALLSNQKLNSKDVAQVFMDILRIHIRKKLHNQNAGLDDILSHIHLLEDVNPENPLYIQTSTPFDQNKLENLENRLKNNNILSKKISKEYLDYIDDLKNGLKDMMAYFSGQSEQLNKKLLFARLYDISMTGDKCEFGFNKEKIVKISYNNNVFILEFQNLKDQAKEIINWLLLAESGLVPKVITENNQQKLIIETNWDFNTKTSAAEAIYRILNNYYGCNIDNQLRDFSLDQKKSGCFIATAAYGSSIAQEVDILRSWRDESLLNFGFGRILIKAYYKISPRIAKIIKNSDIMKMIVRALLKPLIYCIKSKVN